MRIYYIRHGYPNYDKDCLTELGIEQAKKTHEYFKNIKVDKIFCSSLGRAVETARIISGAEDKNLIKCDWATEYVAATYFSYMENDKFHWIFETPSFIEKCRIHQLDTDYLNNEYFIKNNIKNGMNVVNESVDKWLLSMNIKVDRIKNEFTAIGPTPDSIALFAHGGFGMAFMASILNIPYPFVVINFNQHECCGITVIDIDTEKTKHSILYSYNRICY